ncbi:MAG TPA: hypothetical protein EYP49_17465 [Anaerolineae bacterium]|nr:hypothetical protein [Anaerolineae bacterium]
MLPRVEMYYKALDAGRTEPEAQPKVLDIVDSLLELEAMHAQEALCLGHVVGRAQVAPGEIGNPTPMGPRQIIDRLGLTELMECNLSFGYVPTEKATAWLKERSPE